MAGLKKVPKADPTKWLLEEENPSIRYFTLTELLDKPNTDPDVKKARRAIMSDPVVVKILSRQKDGGYWGKPQDFYVHAKYKGTVWTLLLLAQLGADGKNDRIKNGCEFILDYSQDRRSGGFAIHGNGVTGGNHSKVIPCLTGNMLWCLIRFGLLNDSRVRQGLNWIVKYLRFDDGDTRAPNEWPYEKLKPCWDKHTCHMAVVKSLKALAEIPPNKRSKGVNETIEKAAEFILAHHIFKRSHNLQQISIPKWLRFGYPLMWNDDILEILGILAKLGYRDKRMERALDKIINKQDNSGRWKLESTFNGRTQVNIEQLGKPSKWITLQALTVLNRHNSQ